MLAFRSVSQDALQRPPRGKDGGNPSPWSPDLYTLNPFSKDALQQPLRGKDGGNPNPWSFFPFPLTPEYEALNPKPYRLLGRCAHQGLLPRFFPLFYRVRIHRVPRSGIYPRSQSLNPTHACWIHDLSLEHQISRIYSQHISMLEANPEKSSPKP